MRICDRCHSKQVEGDFLMSNGDGYSVVVPSGKGDHQKAFMQSRYDLCKLCADDFLHTVKQFHTTEIRRETP